MVILVEQQKGLLVNGVLGLDWAWGREAGLFEWQQQAMVGARRSFQQVYWSRDSLEFWGLRPDDETLALAKANAPATFLAMRPSQSPAFRTPCHFLCFNSSLQLTLHANALTVCDPSSRPRAAPVPIHFLGHSSFL